MKKPKVQDLRVAQDIRAKVKADQVRAQLAAKFQLAMF